MKNTLRGLAVGTIAVLFTAGGAIAQSIPSSESVSQSHLLAQTLFAQTDPTIMPVTTIEVSNGRLSVRLVNQTGAPISYQAIDDTQVRVLAGESEVLLQNLFIPLSMTFQRDDAGFVQVALNQTRDGVLEITFSSTSDFGEDRNAMTVDQLGRVFLN
jgi:hypothetical protein